MKRNPKKPVRRLKEPVIEAGIGLALLAATTFFAITKVPEEGEYETCMLHPSQTPEGDGWEPMDAVTHTSLYGGLMGKPVGRVVWQRRRPVEPKEPESKVGPFPWLTAHK